MTDWCILRTSPGRTLALADSLLVAGFDVWTPRECQVRRRPRSQATTEIMVPITPGFVFAPYEKRLELAAMARSPVLTYQVWDAGLRRMVQRGHPHFSMFQPHTDFPRVSDASLRGLRAVEQRMIEVTERRRRSERMRGPAPRFSAGDKVRLGDGPFAGIDLIVSEENDGAAVKIHHPDWCFALTISAWTLAAVQLNGVPA